MRAALPGPDAHTTLVLAAQQGDDDAVDALARALWPRIRRQALVTLGDPVLAEDACQEAIVRLLQKLSLFDASRPLGPWLRTLVRNVCHDTAAGQARHHRRERPWQERGHAGGVEHQLDVSRSAARVLEAFQGLSTRQREALDLVDRQGLTPTEASGVMSISPSTVRALLHQGRSVLRARLAHRGEVIALLREENP